MTQSNGNEPGDLTLAAFRLIREHKWLNEKHRESAEIAARFLWAQQSDLEQGKRYLEIVRIYVNKDLRGH